MVIIYVILNTLRKIERHSDYTRKRELPKMRGICSDTSLMTLTVSYYIPVLQLTPTHPNSVCFTGGFLWPRRPGDKEEGGRRVLSSRAPSRLGVDSVSVEREEEERGEGGQGDSDLSRWFSVLLSRERSAPVLWK